MALSSGSSRARSVSTRRRTKGSALAGGVAGLALVRDGAGQGRQVGLAAGGVAVAVPLGPRADQAPPGAAQVAQAAALLGVGVGPREVAAAQEAGAGQGVVAGAPGL